MPKALVAGGAGYIGSVTTQTFLEEGWDVVVMDDLSQGHREAVPREVPLALGDIRDHAFVDDTLRREQPDCILHFAALAAVGESFDRTLDYFDTNIAGTLSLVQAAINADVRNVVFSSSCTVYGVPIAVPITEEEPTKDPISPYGQTKYTCEQLLKWLTQTTPLSCFSLRYFNAAGAWQQLGEDHHPEFHLIPLVIQAALGRRPDIKVYGNDYPTPDGTCIRDYIHVRDLAAAHVSAARQLVTSRGPGFFDVVNLGTGSGSSVMDVISAVAHASRTPVPHQIVPRRPGDPPQLVASNHKARSVLGWTPQHSSLEEVVETALRWHIDHPRGYGKD